MLFLSLLWSCGPKIPLYLQNPMENPHPSCMPSEHIVALGFSIDTISNAQQNARNRVAEQVSSHIETVQTQRKESTQNSSGAETHESELVQESTVSVSFVHYELVKDVGEISDSKKGFRALACLNVAELEQTLLKENASLLDSTVKLGKELLEEENVHSFSIKRQRFQRFRTNLEGFFILLHSLENTYSPQEIELRQLSMQIEAKAKQIRLQHTILLQGNVSKEYQQGLQESMRRAGLTVEQATECQEDAFLMILDENVTPTEGPMGGKLTTLKLRATIRNCATQKEQQIVLLEGKGYHSSDVSLSVKEAWKAVDTEALPMKLGNVFPIMQ